MQQLVLNQEFKNLIPALSEDEYKALEQSIVQEGCRDALVIWEDTIIDGHNRYEICQKHNIDFEITHKSFESLDDAKVWIIDNQKARRNLTDGWKWELAQTKKKILKDKGKEKRKETLGGYKHMEKSVLSKTDKTDNSQCHKDNCSDLSNSDNSVVQNNLNQTPRDINKKENQASQDEPPKDKSQPKQETTKHNTQQEVAEELGWSQGKTAQADYVWNKADEETKQKVRDGDISINQAYNTVKKQEKQKEIEQRKQEYSQRVEEAKANDSIGKIDIYNTDKRFRVIYADPPWKYDLEQTSPQLGGAIKHYDSMSLDDLCALPVSQIAQENSVLFLWITSPKLNYFLKIMDAWGFEYKTSFVWDKVNHNMGHYNSVRHEFLLVGGKGKSAPDVQKLYDSVQSIERAKNHSKKPTEFINIIDELYIDGNRIELFAREASKNTWYYWGDEV